MHGEDGEQRDRPQQVEIRRIAGAAHLGARRANGGRCDTPRRFSDLFSSCSHGSLSADVSPWISEFRAKGLAAGVHPSPEASLPKRPCDTDRRSAVRGNRSARTVVSYGRNATLDGAHGYED